MRRTLARGRSVQLKLDSERRPKERWYLDLRRDEIARYGLSVGAVQDVVMSAIGGENVTTTVEGTPRW